MQIAQMRKPFAQLGDIVLSNGFYIVLVFVVIFFSVSTRHFFSVSNFSNLMHQSAPMMILAAGFAMVVMTGKLDISIGSIAYLSTAVGADLLMRHHYPAAVSLAVVLLLGTLFGLINGVIIVYFKVNPLITTMGTLFIYRGLGLLLTESLTTTVRSDLRRLGNSSIGPFYADFILALVFLVVMQITLRYTPYGRDLTAVGNGEEVAKRLGVNVKRVNLITFALSGLFASMGGVLIVLQVGSHNSHIGLGLEFTGMAMTILGGVSLFGGEGSLVPGFMIGAWTLNIIENGLNHIGASPYAYPFVRGGIIFVAMFADSMKHKANVISKIIVKDA
jgi:ribose/xylose/arabinose/galactoside ABC-type transport system permease subunit